MKAAITRLRRSDVFESELATFLLGKGFEQEAVELVIDRLLGRGLLDDREAIQRFIGSRSGKRALGPLRLRLELLKRGAREADVDEGLSRISESARMEQILGLVESRFPAGTTSAPLPMSDAERAKLTRFVVSRGFDEEDVDSAFSFLSSSVDREAVAG